MEINEVVATQVCGTENKRSDCYNITNSTILQHKVGTLEEIELKQS
jgi:hypothetical protein